MTLQTKGVDELNLRWNVG